jgi:sucrose-6-phosphate hydrolase SacC (GH32 family)
MKRRVRKIANFFAFNLLFFALYLNFIHKDKMVLPTEQTDKPKAAAFSGSVLVDNPEQYLQKTNQTTVGVSEQQAVAVQTKQSSDGPLWLSIN